MDLLAALSASEPRDRPQRAAAAMATTLIELQTAEAASTGSDGSGGTPESEKFGPSVQAGLKVIQDQPRYIKLACLSRSPVFRHEAERELAKNIDGNPSLKQAWTDLSADDLPTVKRLLIEKLREQAKEELAQLKDDGAVKENFQKLTEGQVWKNRPTQGLAAERADRLTDPLTAQ